MCDAGGSGGGGYQRYRHTLGGGEVDVVAGLGGVRVSKDIEATGRSIQHKVPWVEEHGTLLQERGCQDVVGGGVEEGGDSEHVG